MKPERPISVHTKDGLQNHLDRQAKVLTNISFGSTMNNTDREQNMECWKASGTTPAGANTEFAVSHGLGRVPITLAGHDTDNGGVLYRSTTTWSKTQVFLKCTTASAHYNVILI